MDDFNIQALTESRNSYTNLLLSKITPQICQGFETIFEDTIRICEENDEEEKYLMTFQNFLARIPKWNQSMIDEEVERIIKECNCDYLEDLLSCVHITQLKILTSIRVGQKQKELSIDIPNIHLFIHNVYTYCARVLYKNVYLYNVNVMPLEKQKYRKEIETIIKDEIINVIRSSMPVESILKAYLDETMEEEEVFVEKEDNIDDVVLNKPIQNISIPIEKEVENTPQNTPQNTQQNTQQNTPQNTPPNTPPNTPQNIVSSSTNDETSTLSSSSLEPTSVSKLIPTSNSPKHTEKTSPKHTKNISNDMGIANIQNEINDSFIGSRNKNVENVDVDDFSDADTEDYDSNDYNYNERLNIDTTSSITLSDVHDITKDNNKNSLLNLGEIEELP